MNRDLVFFVAGLAFGLAGGYFLFRALAPEGSSSFSSVTESSSSSSAVQTRPPGVEASSIGLEEERAFEELDAAAVARLTERAEANPSDAEARAELGELYMSAGRFQDAVAWLEAAVGLAPTDLDARNQLAIAYLNEGRLTDAVATYEETLSRSPDNPGSLLGLGRIKLYLQQDINGGLALWEKLIQVAPDSTEAKSVADELDALKSAHGS